MAEGEGDFRSDVGCSAFVSRRVNQQVDEHMVVLQQRHTAVPMVKCHVSF